MRWVLALSLVALGCDSLSAPAPASDHGTGSVPGSSMAGTSGVPPMPSLGPILDVGASGRASVSPAEPADWCAEAALQGAVFCAVQDKELEFCEAAASGGASSSSVAFAGGAESTGGPQDVGGAGGAFARDAGGGAGPAGGATLDDAGGAAAGLAGIDGEAVDIPSACPVYEGPPGWVRDMLLECYAHCGVNIVPSSRVMPGACCYRAYSVYAGR
jgi:hypothetical protein